MDNFLKQWGEAAYTTTGFFWMALWAFVLGYIISSMIQIFVTEKRMQKTMGGTAPKGVLLGTLDLSVAHEVLLPWRLQITI